MNMARAEPTGRVLFANPKNNPHPKMPTLAYHITEVTEKDPRTGADLLAAEVEWEEAVDITADQDSPPPRPTKDKGPQSGAVGVLLDVLADGACACKIDERAVAAGSARTS